MSESLDALLPAAMAEKAEQVGVQKANAPAFELFVLAILAGAFIALGAVFATTVATATGIPYGVHRMLIGFAFCLGLVLVVVGGAELFTGNNLIAMAWASRRIGFQQVLRNWGIVYLGNLFGAFGTVGLIHFSGYHDFHGGEVGGTALRIAAAKCEIPFLEALTRGILCNTLVCLAVWMCFSARSTVDRIVAVIFPITAFVAVGFEHSIANLYFIPAGILAAGNLGVSGAEFAPSWGGFIANLIPVTIGNVIGGTGLVAGVYWAVYRRRAFLSERGAAR
jgi:formate transporter